MTTKLASTLKLDLRLQSRYGFYYASALTAILMIILLRQLPLQDLGFLIPVFLVGNLVLNTFYFVAGMVLFEKSEGTLQALAVSPLPIREYLASKVGTLTLLSVVENFAIILLIYGPSFDLLPVLAGTVAMAAIYVLAGFAVVAKYNSISEYIMPSVIYVTALQLPLVDYLGIFKSPVFYLFPAQAPLVLMGSAFTPAESWQIAYGLVYSLICIGGAYILASKAFRKYIVRQEGEI
ncbi:MAG TPA: ABC transporter permease [Methanocella sp.]|nr:ABC transporter permease [Methanocella sp.]